MRFIVLLILFLLTACETRSVIGPEQINRDFPDGWEPFSESTVRKELKPATLEDIVPDDFEY